MTESAIEERVTALIEPALDGLGYELVRIRFATGRGVTLQVMAERADRAPMTVDDCAEISRAVSAILDVDDPIDGAYDLEVSSPGLDRPLVRLRDFERFAGCEVKVEMKEPLDGRRRFRGRLLGTAGGNTVRLALADGSGEVGLSYDGIEKAKLVLSDELIAGDLRAAKA